MNDVYFKTFSSQVHIVSTTTKRVYSGIILSVIVYLNVIYLIKCNRCRLQYVEETCVKYKISVSLPFSDDICKLQLIQNITQLQVSI